MTVAVIRAEPRMTVRHHRYSTLARLRRGKQELAWLATQANRLSTTVAIVYGKLSKYTTEKIRSAANLAAIP